MTPEKNRCPASKPSRYNNFSQLAIGFQVVRPWDAKTRVDDVCSDLL
jgi:hypothetical protein